MHGRDEKYIYKISVGKSERKSLLGRSWRRWDENIKFILKKQDI
jgi:hypothetical protein